MSSIAPPALAVSELQAELIEQIEDYSYEEAFEKSLEYFNGDDLAAKVFLDKYALRNNNQNLLEASPKQMHERLAKEFARIEAKYPNPMSESEIYDLIDNFKYIVPQGSPMTAIGNPYKFQSAGNCFVLESPCDSYAGILYTDQQQAQLMKRRCGVGFDVSNIRPKHMNVRNAARTTDGIAIFMERYSNTCREVAQNGRRGALLQSISVHHPEILTFINIKRDKKKVTGANLSIRLSDEFMKAVDKDTDYELRWPVDSVDPIVSETVRARDIWDAIVDSAWTCGEPGLLFWDNMNQYSPAHLYGKVDSAFYNRSTNPCGEIVMGLDSCRLLLTNLLSFVENPFTDKARFDYKHFSEVVQKAQRLMDDIVDIELELINRIIEKVKRDPEPADVKQIEINMWKTFKDTCAKGRRTGLGVTALGDAIAALGIRYGSEESIKITEKIYKTLAINAYQSSCIMAKERGAFPLYNQNLEENHPFIKRILGSDTALKEMHNKYGRRNIAITTTAPAGSVSVLTQTTSGIEPPYLLSYMRRRKINPDNPNQKADFIDDLGDKWEENQVFHHGLKQWMDITGETDLEKSPYHNATSRDIDWVASVDLQAAAQKWVCHSISKTCNLPSDVSKETVAEVYMQAWKKKCKGFTVYREGCRSGVLIDIEESISTKIVKTRAPKRPKELPSDLHFTTVKGEHYFVVVGAIDGKDPYELFVGNNGFVSKRGVLKGITVREKRGVYHGAFDDIEIRNISSYCSDEEEALTRMVSTALRHGTDVSFIAHQLEKSKGDLSCSSKAIARVLKKYIPDGKEVSGEECQECGGQLTRESGCIICKACGFSKCM